MIKRQNYKDIVWIDCENPNKEEARNLMEEFSLEIDVAQDILLPTFKDKVIVNKNYTYIVLHFPAFKHTHNKSHRQEIDFIFGNGFIITSHYEAIDSMEKYAKIFEVNSILSKDQAQTSSGDLFLAIMKTIYQSLSDELDSINYIIREIERNIFEGKEKEMVFELSKIGRELVNFNNIISPHGEILEKMKNDLKKTIPENFYLGLNEIINEYYKLIKTSENITEIMHELRETNDSLLSTKQNEIMKLLTIFTFFVLPFSIITDLFQMNTINMPFVNHPASWYLIILFEIIVLIILFIIAKKKKWF